VKEAEQDGNLSRIGRGMTSIPRLRIIVSCIFALSVVSLTWVVLGENSPYAEYFEDGILRKLLEVFTAIPYFVLMILRPKIRGEPIALTLVFLQAFGVGYVLTFLVQHFVTGRGGITSLKE
jgi:FtsH-binding integral membrane protein